MPKKRPQLPDLSDLNADGLVEVLDHHSKAGGELASVAQRIAGELLRRARMAEVVYARLCAIRDQVGRVDEN
jgi:hypothetical protein